MEYLRTIEMLEQHGWSRQQCVPHGGHLFALHIAAGLGLGGNEACEHAKACLCLKICSSATACFTLGMSHKDSSAVADPGVFKPFGGFVDGITPVDGYVKVPDEIDHCFGIGIELKADLYAVFLTLLKPTERP
eukprot:SAG31_NODE_4626_length_3087_cov_4.080991_2_plen_133_part_00